MPINRVTPLAPAGVLLLGAALILALGPVLAPRRRHELGVATGALAVLSLFLAGSGTSPDVHVVRVLVEWLGKPALAVRVPPFEPFLWLLALLALAIALAERGVADQLSARDQAGLFALAAAAYGVVLAGNYRTLAYALLLFDGAAALFLLTRQRPGQAVGRLLLGVFSSGLVIALAGGSDPLTAQPPEPGALFSLVTWLRLGLYPLVESSAPGGFLPPLRLGWAALNLAVGLHLISAGVAPWLVWPAGATMLLHGGLAWLEPGRDRALTHAGYALAGGILTMAAAGGESRGVVAASLSTVAALGALGLSAPSLGRPDWRRPGRLWAYLPPLLATASLAGVPFTLGWAGRGALYQATWEAGAPGTLALVVVAEGAALAALYRYWQRCLRPDGKEEAWVESKAWLTLGATLAGIPLLIPVLGPRPPALTNAPPLLSASAGLAGALLWAFFLGYGRRRLLAGMPCSAHTLARALRLGWLLGGLGHALDRLGHLVLRIRTVIEGEHYLAWAILLALALVLVILLR
jgi:hypothetical protein